MNWKAIVVVSVLGLGSIGGGTPARAQGSISGDPEILPLVAGQWAGPWDLGASINHVANPAGGTYLQWCEIVHAVLLPDKTNTGKVHVLLICRRDLAADTSHWPPSRAFIWDAADPSTLDEVPFPAHAANLLNISEDPFCGGHAFTPEGDVVFIGGTNQKKQIELGGTWGHNLVYVFVNDPAGYYWVRAGSMTRERWYPTATAMNDGSILMTGHDEEPSTYVPTTEETFDRGLVAYTGSVPTHVIWQPFVAGESGVHTNIDLPGTSCADQASVLSLPDYPRMHSLLNGQVFWTGAYSVGGPWRHEFLDLFACFTTAITHRWLPAAVGSVLPQGGERGSVHLVDLAASPDEEYVFELDGAVSMTEISNKVVRAQNPAAASLTWVDDEAVAPDLNWNVIDANFSILLDGSIIRTGGFGYDGTPNEYPARKKAEILQPVGIFTLPLTGWKKMAEAQHERRYHSTSVALPNGKVLSAGGDDTEDNSGPEPSWWSVEVFSPPYMFTGPRPRITSFPATVSMAASTMSLGAILRTASAGGEFRVALLAPGAATHAFDHSQKYLKLGHEPVTPSEDPDTPSTIVAQVPASGTTPPGWYMLVVVNSAGVPSNAKWIKLTP